MAHFTKSLAVTCLLVLSAQYNLVSNALAVDWSKPQPSRTWTGSFPTSKKVNVQNDFSRRNTVSNFVNNDFPPNPKAGECYARVEVPAQYKEVKEKIVIREGGVQYETIPAEYEFEDIRVMVEEARHELQIIPATFKTVKEKVMIKPASEENIEIPAKYKTIEEKILINPGYTVWKKGRGPIEKVDDLSGDIMCLVEVPAEYETVTRQIQLSKPKIEKVRYPAEFVTVDKKIVDQPPRVEKISIPAKFDNIAVKKMIRPAEKRIVNVAPEFKVVTKRIPVSSATLAWRSILCETNTTADVVSKIQTALLERKLFSGAVSGVVDNNTMDAIEKFQRKNSLPSGQITLETIEALGVELDNRV